MSAERRAEAHAHGQYRQERRACHNRGIKEMGACMPADAQ